MNVLFLPEISKLFLKGEVQQVCILLKLVLGGEFQFLIGKVQQLSGTLYKRPIQVSIPQRQGTTR